ncbi:hypothetical protein CJP74_03950 [Psittacicella melopsittaci]|uniref:DUF1440 domain-containing protein n=1 Tax=Psittacicella melopsittaci TaxID=2028576 RepID=A0A3A1Y4Z5_9GAMM|nr:DUF1440 domain-containing protein [Psittacicella melopsittaci]RIY32645.1 hypothetical protein CJP74_03950 [Psittacicella melopsittaci]
MNNLFIQTKKSQRRYLLAFFIAIFVGIIAAFVKGGWTQLMPMQVAGETPALLSFLKVFGIEFAGKTYTVLGNNVNWVILGTHIGFSIVLAEVYVILAEIFPKIRMAKGIAYGWISGLAAHYLVFPILSIPYQFTVTGLISELIGATLFGWILEVLRAYLRQGATGYANAEDMPN